MIPFFKVIYVNNYYEFFLKKFIELVYNILNKKIKQKNSYSPLKINREYLEKFLNKNSFF